MPPGADKAVIEKIETEKKDLVTKFFDALYAIALFICKLLLIADILITSMAVAGRYVPFIPDPAWSEEVVLSCMSYMAVLSGALAIRRRAHIRMNAFDIYIPEKLIRASDLVSDFAVTVLALIMITVGWKYAVSIGRFGKYISIPSLSKFWMYFPIPLAGIAMLVFLVESFYNRFKKLTKSGIIAFFAFIAVCLFMTFVKPVSLEAVLAVPQKFISKETLPIWFLLGSFFLMIVLRFPIAYAVALSAILCLQVQGMEFRIVGQQMVKGISSFSLMAVPFFITMGMLMGSGGISNKLIALADACVGWMRGGLAMVNIVASYFFGGISGSASADTASIGAIMIPMMVDQGYDADFSTAVTITSSCEGLLVPPSHNMVIYATTAGGVSVGSLFLAGYLPGAVLAVSLMVGSYIISVRRNYPKGAPFSVKRLLKETASSLWALAAVLIVVVGVVGGVFTATESAAIAVIYSLIVAIFIYRELDWKGVWRVLEDCINTLSIVLILIATSSVFGYCLTLLKVPSLAASAITGFSSNPIVIAILLNMILLILGCIMDMAPIILITTPILLPIATSIGIDPIQFGIMMVLNCGIGLLTPPVGAVLFIGSAVSKLTIEKVVKATLPFYICMIVTLIMVTFIPAISMWIPSLFAK
ncbi:MAG: TRAP transporter large permease subunit [Fusobacteriaceae bacterium]|jgi:tripartite ATP-independent transporter DctM subunit|nr:TRAP transporter large permease subunit [Fusobacteriaceae bacterium]